MIEINPQSTAAQLVLPMSNRRAVEVPELYEQRVKNFYTGMGQSRVSQAKILSGAGVIRNIVEEEGFSLAEVDYTLHWITRNLHARFSGAVKSLGVLPHVIGEALKEREHENKRKEKRMAAVQKIAQDRQKVAGTEHRVGELRRYRAAALPGHALVFYDPRWEGATEVLPCEDAYAQERTLLLEVVPMVAARDCIVADRNFWTLGFVFGVARRSAFFVIRQHGSNGGGSGKASGVRSGKMPGVKPSMNKLYG